MGLSPDYFFFSRASSSVEHPREMLSGSFKIYFPHLRALYKLLHLQVPYGAKMALSIPFLKG